MSIWPESFAQNDSDIKGISVLPIIWVMGEYKSGKSTFVATVDPVRPKQKTRTLVTDLEMSYKTIQTQVPLDVIDIREMTRDKIGTDYTLEDLFVTWRDYVLGIEPETYTVLGVDPASDLYQGSFQWVGKNAALFGKTPQRYNGEMGTKAQWGDTALYWKQLCLELASRFETTVFVSHLKDEYKNNVRTGRREARGGDFSEVASLVLWLDNKEGKRSATVLKSRLSWYDWGDDEGRIRPIIRDLLPLHLELEYSGQSYPDLISQYMAHPQADYGSLNDITDPTIEVQSEQEKEAIRLAELKAKLELETAKKRDEMIKMLIAEGYYKSAVEVARAAKNNDITFTLENSDEVYKKLADLGEQK